jgi:hypothetical protein
VLERFKHLFDVPGIVFVLSTNMAQLGHSIRGAYGDGFDDAEYLRRFVDLSLQLPLANPEQYATVLLREYGLLEVIEKRHGSETNEGTAIVTYFAFCASFFTLSLRDQEQLFTQLNLVFRLTPTDFPIPIPLLVFLIFLKRVDPEMYEQYGSATAGAADVIASITSTTEKEATLQTRMGNIIRAYLVACSGIEQELDLASTPGVPELPTRRTDVRLLLDEGLRKTIKLASSVAQPAMRVYVVNKLALTEQIAAQP